MNAMEEMQRIDNAAQKVLEVCGTAEIGVILGSGLGDYAQALEEALPLLGQKLAGFANPGALMTGVEARSSSPVRIVRDA